MIRTLGLLAATLAAVTLALALPSMAGAQTGEDQYADPFGDLPEDDPRGAGGGGDTDGEPVAVAGTGDEGGAGDAGQSAPPADADGSVEDADIGSVSAEELPRTGLRAGLLIALGVGLLGSGALLQLALLRTGRTLADLAPWRTSAVHSAPRPPGFDLPRRRAVRRRRR